MGSMYVNSFPTFAWEQIANEKTRLANLIQEKHMKLIKDINTKGRTY